MKLVQATCILMVVMMACSPSQKINHIGTTSDSYIDNLPRNVILMIGDGMGLSQISGAMYTSKRGLQLERFQHVGLQKTQCKNHLVTDSAAAAAALARGIKADKNTFGTDDKNIAPLSILEELERQGYATGMIVTSSLTHATPAAFISYQPHRSMYEEIALDFLKVKVDYLVGGGKQYFDGRSIDNRNILSELGDDIVIKSYLDGNFSDISIPANKRFIYFSAEGEPNSHAAGRNYLVSACRRGVPFLEKRSEIGFFLMVEGSQIDWGCHANLPEIAMDELQEFDLAVGVMADYAMKDGNTLLIVTGDHETGGFSITGENTKGEPEFSFVSKHHTASLIPVFAYGPGSEMFAGVYENTEIHNKILEAIQIVE